MELLYPSKTYVIGANILKYRPTLRLDGVRQVSLANDETEMQRRANFSFAVIDMLQINAQVKLMLLQVPFCNTIFYFSNVILGPPD